jgi:hypothetical protein
VVTAPSLLDQLHGKVHELRRMSDQLRQGDLLRDVVRQANDQSVWVRGPQTAFCGWVGALDAWMRNQLAGAVDLVRQKVEAYVSAFDNAQLQFANGIPGAALPPPPPPVGAVAPNCPYPFVMQVSKGTNPMMNPDLMRKGLVNALGRAKDDVHAFSTRLGDLLAEPAAVPGAPVVPGAPPMHHLPPDAKEAAGVPSAYDTIKLELEKAIQDVVTRAQTWEEAQAADNTSAPSIGGFSGLLKTASDLIEHAREQAVVAPPPAPTTEAEAPAPVDVAGEAAPVAQPPPPPEESRKAADDLVAEYPPNDKTLDDPNRIEELGQKLHDHVPNPDPVFAARFVERFGAKSMIAMGRSLQAWQQGWDKLHDSNDPRQRGLALGKAYDKPTKEQVEGVIYSFSATLATATTSGSLSDKVEDDLLNTNDPLALSWLLCDPNAHFDPAFLVRAFDKCVKNVIVYDASQKGQGIPGMGGGHASPGLVLTGSILSHDPKIAALEAISRNPEAALRLQREFKPFDLRYGGGHGSERVASLSDLLYRGADLGQGYPDAGNCVGRTLTTIYDSLLAQSQSNVHAGAEARTLLDQMVKSAATTPLPDGAREGLAHVVADHISDIASILNGQSHDKDSKYAVPQVFTANEIALAITEIAHDPKALATVMGGFGDWVSGMSDDFAAQIAAQPDPAKLDSGLRTSFIQENERIGTAFCKVAHSVRTAGIQDRDKALASLANFKFGVGIVFDAVKKIPVVGAVTDEVNTASIGVSGKVADKGEDALKDKVASWMSGVDAEEEAAKSKDRSQQALMGLDAMLFDKSMGGLAKHPLAVQAILASDPKGEWPPSMLLDPNVQVPKSPLPTDPMFLKQYVKPQYLTGDGCLRFPELGDPAYVEYRDWCGQPWNNVSGRAKEMSKEASDTMHDCMVEVGWIDAS